MSEEAFYIVGTAALRLQNKLSPTSIIEISSVLLFLLEVYHDYKTEISQYYCYSEVFNAHGSIDYEAAVWVVNVVLDLDLPSLRAVHKVGALCDYSQNVGPKLI